MRDDKLRTKLVLICHKDKYRRWNGIDQCQVKLDKILRQIQNEI